MFDYDFLKTQIKNITPAEMENHGIINPARAKANGELTYICPYCNNGGKGKANDGLAVKTYSWGYNYKCFSCGKSFDNIALLAFYYRIENSGKGYFEILKRAAAEFGFNANFQDFSSYHNLKPMQIREKIIAPPIKSAEELTQEANLIALIQKDITFARANLKDFITSNGGKWRDLTFETLDYFNCGYDEYWINPYARLKNVRNATPTPRVIIPSGNSYLARLTVNREVYKNAPDFEYIKEKPHFGSLAAFGVKTISAATEIVIATEGEIDCMTNWQSYHVKEKELDFLRFTCNIFETSAVSLITDNGEKPLAKATLAKKAFIATCGAASKSWIDEVDTKCKELNCRPLFVITFDDDDAGRINAPKCKTELNKRNYPVAVKFLQKKG